MTRISDSQIKMAYIVSKEVFLGKLRKIDGALILSDDYDLNKASAGDFINCFKCMAEGRIFQRAMSCKAMDIFIKNIADDFSFEVLENALNALELHINYYEAQYDTNSPSMRKILNMHRATMFNSNSIESIFNQFQKDIDKSLSLSSDERKRFINASDPNPKQITVSVKVYQRNSHVVAERASIADGICERCKTQAPFLRAKDGSPYLEVHHIKHLSEGGLDTLDNTIALCPNCHRELHFGQ
ncbi:HNH endonuclease [Pseudoalteromonas rhizosphaerae]|uniref:HNH endonuclease n=1 Tax=Pseudoalteromonas rhizosphaerae TaxID=2518973 RepID=UPI001231205F|nr:HNH endonuclease signature motif containing protein [Pseudoalteromonas rhizosphaerae]